MIKYQLGIISSDQEKIAKEFADKVYLTNKHEYGNKRNQNDSDKIKFDNVQGKIGEQLVRNFFIKKGREVSPVDFEIYEKQNKSYSPDLIMLDENKNPVFLHVKTCTENEKFPISWLFQPNDPLVVKPLANDFLVLVVFPLVKFVDNNDVEHTYSSKEAFCYFKNANNVTYRDPKKTTLIKKVIYEEDLLK